MSSDIEQIGWGEIWRVLRGSHKLARRRALRETGVVIAFSLLPLLFGAFFAYIRATRELPQHDPFYLFAYKATLAGQLFLVFLSLAGSIFAKVWDPDGPRYAFSATLNLFHLGGAILTAGLLAIDMNMTSFEFWPVGAMSILFFAVAIIHYFAVSVPGYLKKPDLQQSTARRSEELEGALEQRMGANGP